MDPEAIHDRAQAALLAGQSAEAQRLLAQVLQVNPRHEQAWLDLSTVVPNLDQSLDCIERVVAINPGNAQAQTMLDQARKEKVRREVLAMLEGPAPAVEEEKLSRLGKYLLKAQFITPMQLDLALAEQQKTASAQKPRRLGEILVEQGVITDQQLDQAVRDQFRDFNNLFIG